MSADLDYLDAKIAEVLNAPVKDGSTLTIWGGRFDAGQLKSFLLAWGVPRPEMPWCLWEFASDMQFLCESMPTASELAWLERGRVFGKGGDLSLRRDRDKIMWSYVGKAEDGRPTIQLAESFEAVYHPASYWTTDSLPLREYTDRVLLWGKRRPDGIWHDDRVARARVNRYPGMDAHERVQLVYHSYMNGGQVEFVWLLGLEGAT